MLCTIRVHETVTVVVGIEGVGREGAVFAYAREKRRVAEGTGRVPARSRIGKDSGPIYSVVWVVRRGHWCPIILECVRVIDKLPGKRMTTALFDRRNRDGNVDVSAAQQHLVEITADERAVSGCAGF